MPFVGSRITLLIDNITNIKPKIRANPAITKTIMLNEENKLFSSSSYFLWKRINVEDIPRTNIETNEVKESTVDFKPKLTSPICGWSSKNLLNTNVSKMDAKRLTIEIIIDILILLFASRFMKTNYNLQTL